MPFSGDTFTHLFSWDQDPQRQEKIINARLEAEFDGIDTGLSTVKAAIGTPRTVLTAARTYYVRTDGSDSNTGLTNTAGGAFLTIQKAVNVIAETLDVGAQTVTVQVGDGTYTGAVTLKNAVGFGAAGSLIIQGNNATPANVVISTTSAGCFTADGVSATWDIKDMKLQTTTSGICIRAQNGSKLRFGNIDFGASATHHISASESSSIDAISNYSITGGATYHMTAVYGGLISLFITVTLTGTPAFTTFADAHYCGVIEGVGTTYSGGATGKRYDATLNAVINTSGGGANFFPGNAAGTTATGGQYA